MEMTANDLIERAMVKARIISPGEAPPAGKVYQVLDNLNDLLESWFLEDLMIVYDVLESFVLAIGQTEYTYGTGGDFDSVRPLRIKDESFIRVSGVDHLVGLHPLGMYRRKSDKTTTGRPIMMAYHPEYPLGKIFLYPTPSTIDSLYMRASKALVSFTDLTTSVDLEPGWSRALISNLAVEISLDFGKKISAELAALSIQSKQFIKSANSSPPGQSTNPELAAMAGGGSAGNINSGPYG